MIEKDERTFYVVRRKDKFVRVHDNGTFDLIEDFWKATWWKDLFTARMWKEIQRDDTYEVVELVTTGVIREIRGYK